MFLPVIVCLFVCLSVCLWVSKITQKSYGRIFLKFSGNVGNGKNYQWFNFGGDPAGILDSGSLWNFRRTSCVGTTWPWRRSAGYDCFLVELLMLWTLFPLSLHRSVVSPIEHLLIWDFDLLPLQASCIWTCMLIFDKFLWHLCIIFVIKF